MKTILVQGAMDSEIEQLINMLSEHSEVKKTEHNGYFFYETKLNDVQIIVAKTEMGIMNATVSTMIASEKYQPSIVINQGTAGAHLRSLNVGDIIIGEEAVYINNMRSPAKQKGEGSNALEWQPGKSLSFLIKATDFLVEKASAIEFDSKVLCGRLGSGDVYSKEVDRIDLLHSQLGELCEDMESVAVYKCCQTLEIPFVGICVISNNELTGNGDVEKQFEIAQTRLQSFIFKFLKQLVDTVIS